MFSLDAIAAAVDGRQDKFYFLPDAAGAAQNDAIGFHAAPGLGC